MLAVQTVSCCVASLMKTRMDHCSCLRWSHEKSHQTRPKIQTNNHANTKLECTNMAKSGVRLWPWCCSHSQHNRHAEA